MSTQEIGLAIRTDRRLDLLASIKSDYRVLPQLALTVAQASRLWAVEHDTCKHLLDLLVEDGFLLCRSDGRYGLPRAIELTSRQCA